MVVVVPVQWLLKIAKNKMNRLIYIVALLLGLNTASKAQDAIYKEFPLGVGIPTGSIKETHSPTAYFGIRGVAEITKNIAFILGGELTFFFIKDSYNSGGNTKATLAPKAGVRYSFKNETFFEPFVGYNVSEAEVGTTAANNNLFLGGQVGTYIKDIMFVLKYEHYKDLYSNVSIGIIFRKHMQL